jgi:hypothetical protein
MGALQSLTHPLPLPFWHMGKGCPVFPCFNDILLQYPPEGQDRLRALVLELKSLLGQSCPLGAR